MKYGEFHELFKNQVAALARQSRPRAKPLVLRRMDVADEGGYGQRVEHDSDVTWNL